MFCVNEREVYHVVDRTIVSEIPDVDVDNMRVKTDMTRSILSLMG